MISSHIRIVYGMIIQVLLICMADCKKNRQGMYVQSCSKTPFSKDMQCMWQNRRNQLYR